MHNNVFEKAYKVITSCVNTEQAKIADQYLYLCSGLVTEDQLRLLHNSLVNHRNYLKAYVEKELI
jgi:hypothetical protein